MLTTRRLISSFFAVCVVAIAPLQASSATARTYVLTRENSGETVVVNVGDRVIVKLPGQRTHHNSWSIGHPAGGGARLVTVSDAARAYRADFQATRPGLVTVSMKTLAFTFDVEQPQIAQRSALFHPIVRRARVLAAPRAPVALVAAPVPVANTVAFTAPGKTVTGGGTETYSNGSSYSGGLKDGLPFGDGTLTFTTNIGNVLSETGYWDAGVLTHGTVVERDGTKYFGGLDAQGRLQGPGRFDNPDGSVLTSTFAAGLYSGPTLWLAPRAGTETAQATISVDVDPPSSMPNGPAKETFDDGTTLVGTLGNGIFVGPATYVDPGENGTTSSFHAAFMDGVLQGPFTSTDSNGFTIAGTIAGGTTEGPAVLTTRNGLKCRGGILESGDFVGFSGVLDHNALADGYGTSGCPGEEQITGQWVHGKMVGKMIDRFPNGNVYVVDVGPYPRSDLVGRAFVKLANEDRAVGYMASNGLLSGRGSYLTASSDLLIRGDWVDGTIREKSQGHGYFCLDCGR